MFVVKGYSNWLRASCLVVCITLIASCSSPQMDEDPAAEFSTQYPNIVYILADDLGVGDIKALNRFGKIRTPHIDQLAKEGMIFRDAHSNSSVCTPTRYGIMTGRYSWRTRLQTGVLESYSPPLIAPDRLTAASLLKTKGYATACVGKWHLGWDWPTLDGRPVITSGLDEGANVDYAKPIIHGPRASGFDYFFGIPASLDMVPYVYVENENVLQSPTASVGVGTGQAFHRGGPSAPGFKHEDVLPRCTEKAVDFITAHAESDKQSPFFLYFPLSAPHAPIVPAKHFRGISGVGTYGDFVHQVDWSVGRIMKTLVENGLDKNTLVIFTADNGCAPGANFDELALLGHDPSGGLRGLKGDIFEGGHRIPFIAKWPGQIAPRSSTETAICLTDFVATVADIVDTKLPENSGEDSCSMLPIMLGQEPENPSRGIVHHSSNGSFAIRSGKWKLILCPGSGGHSHPRTRKALMLGLPKIQLYNLSRDLSETDNVAAHFPAIVKKLTALLTTYVERGRSTVGLEQSNDETPHLRKADHLKQRDYTPTQVDHVAKGKPLRLMGATEVKYAKNGLAVLTDGIRATTWYDDGHWAGFLGDDLDVVIDLEESRPINIVRVGFLASQNLWIFQPTEVVLSISSDGKYYSEGGRSQLGAPAETDKNAVRDVTFDLGGVNARWVRIRATNVGTCPSWHKGRGGKAWLFVDEVVVE